MPIARNKVVYLDYVLRDDSGQVLEETEGDPFAYIHGLNQLVPGLESRLEGLDVGDERELVVPPEEGHGMPDPEGIFTVPRDAFPEGQQISVGDLLMGEGEDGETMPVRVVEVQEQEVRVDANHPLAGQTLHYTVSVRHIRDATPEEIAHEHPHDGDEHAH